jgi:hypothetical protein
VFAVGMGIPRCRYGTILNMTKFEQLSDGRSLVETVGSTRFAVNEVAERDGYTVATVTMVEDAPDFLPSTSGSKEGGDTSAEHAMRQLEEDVRRACGTARAMFPPRLVEQLGAAPAVDQPHLVPFAAFNILPYARHCVGGVQGDQFSGEAAEAYEFCYGDATRTSHLARLKVVARALNVSIPRVLLPYPKHVADHIKPSVPGGAKDDVKGGAAATSTTGGASGGV